jgi:Family of unknown function (DUF5985)
MMKMADLVFVLCAITSVLCATLLYRGYRKSRSRLLFWSALCFAGLGLNNILLVVDLSVLPAEIDLSLIRSLPAVAGLGLLIYGLIWEVK